LHRVASGGKATEGDTEAGRDLAPKVIRRAARSVRVASGAALTERRTGSAVPGRRSGAAQTDRSRRRSVPL